jgi:hypothetical protein
VIASRTRCMGSHREGAGRGELADLARSDSAGRGEPGSSTSRFAKASYCPDRGAGGTRDPGRRIEASPTCGIALSERVLRARPPCNAIGVTTRDTVAMPGAPRSRVVILRSRPEEEWISPALARRTRPQPPRLRRAGPRRLHPRLLQHSGAGERDRCETVQSRAGVRTARPATARFQVGHRGTKTRSRRLNPKMTPDTPPVPARNVPARHSAMVAPPPRSDHPKTLGCNHPCKPACSDPCRLLRWNIT